MQGTKCAIFAVATNGKRATQSILPSLHHHRAVTASFKYSRSHHTIGVISATTFRAQRPSPRLMACASQVPIRGDNDIIITSSLWCARVRHSRLLRLLTFPCCGCPCPHTIPIQTDRQFLLLSQACVGKISTCVYKTWAVDSSVCQSWPSCEVSYLQPKPCQPSLTFCARAPAAGSLTTASHSTTAKLRKRSS